MNEGVAGVDGSSIEVSGCSAGAGSKMTVPASSFFRSPSKRCTSSSTALIEAESDCGGVSISDGEIMVSVVLPQSTSSAAHVESSDGELSPFLANVGMWGPMDV